MMTIVGSVATQLKLSVAGIYYLRVQHNNIHDSVALGIVSTDGHSDCLWFGTTYGHGRTRTI
jgi:hypothetical protein